LVAANIPFLAKVIEKVVAAQIHSYLEENLLMPSMQSAYRNHHSTETALLRVMNAVLRTVDCRQDVVLVMHDLPAVFDTLDHTILLDRLSRYFGFSHPVLRWFSSYLTGWIQSVTIGNTTSGSRRLEFGVSQGSILGPLLFTLYTAPIQDIISAHNLDCMFCTDDSQLYITVDPHDQHTRCPQHPSEVYS